MHTLTPNRQVPVYKLIPDILTGNPNFRVYQFNGNVPDHSEMLIPHRKAHYLLVFVRHATSRQWVDMIPYVLKDNTMYLTVPNQVIVKEEFTQLWSTGIAFTNEFLSLQENEALSQLPMLLNPQNGPEIILTEADVKFVEEMLARIDLEYQTPGEWQHRLLSAYLTALLTYLSRLYAKQSSAHVLTPDKLVLKQYQLRINESFRELHEVGDYASMLHMSPGHLSEVVKTQSGKPAIKHIHDRLILEARRVLFHTNNPLKEIAFDLGFTDASYFNRFFKRETGVTPANYRMSIREMYQ